MTSIEDLSREQLVSIVSEIQRLLWREYTIDNSHWNPDLEWDADTIEAIAYTLEGGGLKPEQDRGVK